MKTNAFLVFIFLFTACNEGNKQMAFIKGKIIPTHNEKLFLYQVEKYPIGQKKIDSIFADADGAFCFKFPLVKPNLFFVKTSNFKTCNFYFEPGDSIHLLLNRNENNRQQIYLSGNYNKVNNYLLMDYNVSSNFNIFKYIDENANLVFLLDSIAGVRDSIYFSFKEICDQTPLSSYLKNFHKIDMANLYYQYLQYSDNVNYKYFLPDTTFYKFIEYVDFEDVGNSYLPGYADFLTNYINDLNEHSKQLNGSQNKNRLLSQLQIAKTKLSEKNLPIYITNLSVDFNVYFNLNRDYLEFLTFAEKLMPENETDPDLYFKFYEKYNYFKYMLPGEKFFNFELIDTSGIKHLINDFVGKYVYIDVWSTYCKYCISSIPNYNNLVQKMEDKNIEFIDICMISDEDDFNKYLNILRKTEFKGKHFYLDEKTFLRKTCSSRLPRYILLDPKGEVIENWASEPGIIDDFLFSKVNSIVL